MNLWHTQVGRYRERVEMSFIIFLESSFSMRDIDFKIVHLMMFKMKLQPHSKTEQRFIFFHLFKKIEGFCGWGGF